ncbi:MAG: hypothetical protein ACREQC_11685, partial [Candidatus Binataceae bacterium]
RAAAQAGRRSVTGARRRGYGGEADRERYQTDRDNFSKLSETSHPQPPPSTVQRKDYGADPARASDATPIPLTRLYE